MAIHDTYRRTDRTEAYAGRASSEKIALSLAGMVKARRKFDIYFAAGVLCLSLAIAAVGLLTRVDLNVMLGDWRPGVLVLAGAFFLFVYTIQLHLSLRHESRLSELEHLYFGNNELAERARGKLQDRNISAAE